MGDDLDNEISADQGWDETQVDKRWNGDGEPPYRPYPEDRSNMATYADWEDWDPELNNEISADQGWDETKVDKRSQTWPVPPWEDDRYKDCFTDGMLDPTKCPYRRSTDQGWLPGLERCTCPAQNETL